MAKEETKNGQKVSSSIFQHFQILSDKLGRYTCLIYPGGRWIHRSGKGMEQFGLEQINDPHLAKLHLFPISTEIFQEVAIADGLSIVLKDMKKENKGFRYLYTKQGKTIEIQAENPGHKLMPLNPLDLTIVSKIRKGISDKFGILHDAILPRCVFSIESDFVEKNPSLVREYSNKENIRDDEIKLFTNDKAGKSGRAKWYIANKDVITTGKEYLPQWKVIVSSANAGGQKRSNQLDIVDNRSAFGRSRVALKTFATKEEAQNFFFYCKSDFIRYAFLLTDEALTSLAKLVPDIQNYTDNNGIINFKKDIDEQLYALFEIADNEQKYISQFLAERNIK